MKRIIFLFLVMLCSYVCGCSYARVEKYSQLEAFSPNKAKKKGKSAFSFLTKPIKDFRGNGISQESIEVVNAKVEEYISLHKDLDEVTKNNLKELTVTEGATKEEVKLLLGKPTKTAKFKNVQGYTEIWIYKINKTDPLPMFEIPLPVSFHQSYRLYFKENTLAGIEMHYLKHSKFGKVEKLKQKQK